MGRLNFEVMQELQRELQERYRDRWPALSPTVGRDKLLWMMIEAGEMADIIKKQGDREIMENDEVRRHFVEELCDTLMYLNDVMLCYQISPEELEQEYYEKHRINRERWSKSTEDTDR